MAPAQLPPDSLFHLPALARNTVRQGDPEVSVSVVTYNQVGLLGRALDSILQQQVNFPLEIVVGDDCSTDGTKQLIEAYTVRYPSLLRPIFHNSHLPGIPGRANNMLNPMACRGKYTALLDGDDYWTDPLKLQRQYDVMERHPTLSCCFHDTELREVDAHNQLLYIPHSRNGTGAGRRRTGFYPHEEFCLDRNIKVHTSSCFFRTGVFGDWPEGYDQVVAADHYLFLLITQRGPVFYDERIMSVNERQPASLTNSAAYLAEHRIERRVRDLRTYRERFPATNITSSYSAAAVRWLKQLCLLAIRRGELRRLCVLIGYTVREPRGVIAVISHWMKKQIGGRS